MKRAATVFLSLGAVSAAVAVMAGAFGAHTLGEIVSDARLEIFKTAAQYQLIHSVALVLLGVIELHASSSTLRWSGWVMVVGIVLFSGSLYALVLTDTSALGIITPFGGVAFICGWLLLAAAVWRMSRAANT